MALQGTIDTFPLTDVLALLASSSRSGRLTVSGDRGSGTVWIHDQAVLGGQLGDGRRVGPDRIIFELLRFTDGSFEFDAVDRTDFPEFHGTSGSIEDCIGVAAQMIEDWAEIEALVPSIEHRIDLVAELSEEQLTVDRVLWRVLVTVSRCSSVADLSEELGVDDYEGSALVASLVQERLVDVSQPCEADPPIDEITKEGSSERVNPRESADGGTAPVVIGDSEDRDPLVTELIVEEVVDEAGHEFPDHFPIDDLISGQDSDSVDGWSASAIGGSDQLGNSGTDVSNVPVQGGGTFDGWDELVGTHGAEADSSADDAAEEVLRQMSKLSPKAAEAIAAALGTTDTTGEDGSVATADQTDAEDGQAKVPGSDPENPGPISFLDSF